MPTTKHLEVTMSNKKQSSIEWLENQLKERYSLMNSEPLFEQAEAMHKEEVKESYREGRSDQQSNEKFYHRNAQLYFNETFGGEK